MIEAESRVVKCLAARWSFGREDRVLWVSSLEFDLSIFDLFGILGVGGAVVIPPPDGKQNPLGWAEAVRRHGVTVWNSVPALADHIFQVQRIDFVSTSDGTVLDYDVTVSLNNP